MSPPQGQGPAMLPSIHILLSSWGHSQAVFVTFLQFWAKLRSVVSGQILVLPGRSWCSWAPHSRLSHAQSSLSARARTLSFLSPH